MGRNDFSEFLPRMRSKRKMSSATRPPDGREYEYIQVRDFHFFGLFSRVPFIQTFLSTVPRNLLRSQGNVVRPIGCATQYFALRDYLASLTVLFSAAAAS